MCLLLAESLASRVAMDRAKRKQPSADEPGEGGGAAGAAGDESKQAGGGGATGSSQYKRARVALVKVDETSGAIVKRVESRTSKLTAPIMLLTGHKVRTVCVLATTTTTTAPPPVARGHVAPLTGDTFRLHPRFRSCCVWGGVWVVCLCACVVVCVRYVRVCAGAGALRQVRPNRRAHRVWVVRQTSVYVALFCRRALPRTRQCGVPSAAPT